MTIGELRDLIKDLPADMIVATIEAGASYIDDPQFVCASVRQPLEHDIRHGLTKPYLLIG